MKCRCGGAVWVLALAALAAAPAVSRGASAPADTRPPNIILVVIDTLRADRLGGHYGRLRGLTPFLNELADRGTMFSNAYAPSSWTCPSIASLFTSRFPSQHRVASFDSVLQPAELSLAESLNPLGYRGAGVLANFRLTADLGYGQGFAFWDPIFPPQPEVDAKVRGGRVREHAKAWLGANPAVGTRTPLFLYLHYLEPHAPYDPPEPFRSRLGPADLSRDQAKALNIKVMGFGPGNKGLVSRELAALGRLYDGEVASVDDEIRQTFDVLEQAGVLDHAVIIVTADHGEEFGDHGEVMHGHTLYNDAIRIPLIIVAPGYPARQVVGDPVSLLDVAPTILALAGGAPEPRHEGRSLVPLLGNGDETPAPVGEPTALLAELLPFRAGPEAPGNRLHYSAIIQGDRKGLLGTTGAVEVYDLASDPAERYPLPPLTAVDWSDLLVTLDTMQSALADRAAATGLAHPLDDATKEKLRALGYQY